MSTTVPISYCLCKAVLYKYDFWGCFQKEDSGLWELGRHCQRSLLHVSEKNEDGLELIVRVMARGSGWGTREEEKVESLP